MALRYKGPALGGKPGDNGDAGGLLALVAGDKEALSALAALALEEACVLAKMPLVSPAAVFT